MGVNPLEPGCSRSPGRLAPASSKEERRCPGQESTPLVPDLRKVVCESGTLRGRLAGYLDSDSAAGGDVRGRWIFGGDVLLRDLF